MGLYIAVPVDRCFGKMTHAILEIYLTISGAYFSANTPFKLLCVFFV